MNRDVNIVIPNQRELLTSSLITRELVSPLFFVTKWVTKPKPQVKKEENFVSWASNFLGPSPLHRVAHVPTTLTQYSFNDRDGESVTELLFLIIFQKKERIKTLSG